MSRRYSCVKCQLFFKIKRNGVVHEEGMPLQMREGKGEGWKPYKLFMADLYECAGCGTQLAVAGNYAIKEHFMPDYESTKAYYEAAGLLLPIVKDC